MGANNACGLHLPAAHCILCNRDNEILSPLFRSEVEPAHPRNAIRPYLPHISSQQVDGLIAAHIDCAFVVDREMPVFIMHAVGMRRRECVQGTFSALPVPLGRLRLQSSRGVCSKLEILGFFPVHPAHKLEFCQQLLQRRFIAIHRASS